MVTTVVPFVGFLVGRNVSSHRWFFWFYFLGGSTSSPISTVISAAMPFSHVLVSKNVDVVFSVFLFYLGGSHGKETSQDNLNSKGQIINSK